MRDDVKYLMCENKKRFKTEKEAIAGAINSSKKFGPMRTYKCPYCNGWHLTHKCKG